jgi:chromosome segregation ATPase
MPKGDHVLKSKSAASVFESPQQRDQLLAKVGAPGPKKGLAPTPVPRSQTSAGLKAPSPRSSGQMGQLNATLGNLCSEITDLQQQREALDQQIQEHISSLKQEIESMSKGGNSDTWVALKAKLEDLHQQESDLTTKYAEVSKSLTETRQLVRLAELQQLLEQIEAKDNLSETPRH